MRYTELPHLNFGKLFETESQTEGQTLVRKMAVCASFRPPGAFSKIFRGLVINQKIIPIIFGDVLTLFTKIFWGRILAKYSTAPKWPLVVLAEYAQKN